VISLGEALPVCRRLGQTNFYIHLIDLIKRFILCFISMSSLFRYTYVASLTSPAGIFTTFDHSTVVVVRTCYSFILYYIVCITKRLHALSGMHNLHLSERFPYPTTTETDLVARSSAVVCNSVLVLCFL
jgi:hypothetical protein